MFYCNVINLMHLRVSQLAQFTINKFNSFEKVELNESLTTLTAVRRWRNDADGAQTVFLNFRSDENVFRVLYMCVSFSNIYNL